MGEPVSRAVTILEDLLSRPYERVQHVTIAEFPDWRTNPKETKLQQQECVDRYREIIDEMQTIWGRPEFSGPYYEEGFPAWSEGASEATYWRREERLAYVIMSGTGPVPDPGGYIYGNRSPGTPGILANWRS